MKKLTIVSTWHYIRLVYRSCLFLLLLISYISYRFANGRMATEHFQQLPAIPGFICLVFTIEMIFRFFPSKLESPGCQKQFARNYLKSGKTQVIIQDNNATVLVALIWIAFNAVFGILYMTEVFDDVIMLLLSSIYSVCDMICILFFCPFQTWFMKNRCCTTCRIYNWDYAMMFTPLFFIKSFWAWSLLGLSLILAARWEITFFRHPERFSPNTNEYLKCKNCTEKLCTHKTQLHSLWKNIEVHTTERINRLKKQE